MPVILPSGFCLKFPRIGKLEREAAAAVPFLGAAVAPPPKENAALFLTREEVALTDRGTTSFLGALLPNKLNAGLLLAIAEDLLLGAVCALEGACAAAIGGFALGDDAAPNREKPGLSFGRGFFAFGIIADLPLLAVGLEVAPNKLKVPPPFLTALVEANGFFAIGTGAGAAFLARGWGEVPPKRVNVPLPLVTALVAVAGFFTTGVEAGVGFLVTGLGEAPPKRLNVPLPLATALVVDGSGTAGAEAGAFLSATGLGATFG